MKRVVIVGGGFAGISTAQELAKQLKKSGRLFRPGRVATDESVEVVLLNRDNYFVFQPLLADILSATIETTHVVVPLRRMLPGVQIDVGIVESIDTDAGVVHMRRRQKGDKVTVAYDELVVALGSITDFRSVPGMAENALGIRTLGDAFYLRNRALDILEEARLEADQERRKRLLTTVVVGGGSTGVEVAAELHDLFHTAVRTFAVDPPLQPRVVLVHAGPYLLNTFDESLGRYTTRRLAKTGVELILNRRLASVEAGRVVLDDGSSIETETVVSTVGNAPHPVVTALDGAHDERGWITPDASFRVPGLDHVWALGDCASIVDPKTGKPMPATAQHAVREGPHAARNIVAALDGKPATPFSYAQLGMLVSLGRYRGVGEILGVKVSGLIAWIAWRGYYLLRLPTWDRKIRVAVDWTLDWFLRRDVVEINVRRSRTSPQQSDATTGADDELSSPRLRGGVAVGFVDDLVHPEFGPEDFEEPRWARFLFASRAAAWLWLVVRLYMASVWLPAGWGKVTSGAWLFGDGAPVAGFVGKAVADPGTPTWYVDFANNIVLPNAGLFATLVALGEVAVGLGLLVGLLTGFAAFFAVFMSANYVLSGVLSSNPIQIILGLFLVVAWRNAGWIGLDRLFLPWAAGRFRRGT